MNYLLESMLSVVQLGVGLVGWLVVFVFVLWVVATISGKI